MKPAPLCIYLLRPRPHLQTTISTTATNIYHDAPLGPDPGKSSSSSSSTTISTNKSELAADSNSLLTSPHVRLLPRDKPKLRWQQSRPRGDRRSGHNGPKRPSPFPALCPGRCPPTPLRCRSRPLRRSRLLHRFRLHRRTAPSRPRPPPSVLGRSSAFFDLIARGTAAVASDDRPRSASFGQLRTQSGTRRGLARETAPPSAPAPSGDMSYDKCLQMWTKQTEQRRSHHKVMVAGVPSAHEVGRR